MTWNIEPIILKYREAVADGVAEVAEAIRKDAYRRIVEPPKTGRLYQGAPFRIDKPPHQASAPGEAPADDTGALKASGKVIKEKPLAAAVSFNAGYARNLEMGIPTGDYPLEARPFLRPAVEDVRKRTKEIIEQEIRK